MPRLTLHIGVHRTGTTGLQRTLAANRDRLVLQDKSYPGDQTNHQEMAWSLHRGQMSGDDVVDRLRPDHKYAHLIVSGEDFCIHQDLAWLAPLRRIYDVDAVVYLRRQDHWLMSWYNQHVKWPFSRRHSVMTPQEFLLCLDEFYWLDYDWLLRLWGDALGRDNLKVRVIEKGQVQDSITDFFALAGIDHASFDMHEALQNDSLPIETLEFARQAGMIDMRPGRRMAVINYLKSVVKSKEHTGKTLYTYQERQGVLDRFSNANRQVARDWFDRDILFGEAPPDDRDLYVEGTLAAHSNYQDLLMKSLAFLAK